MSRRKRRHSRLKAIQQINELLAQATDLLPALDVDANTEDIEFAELAEFVAVASEGGLRAVAIGTVLVCGAGQSLGTRNRINEILAAATATGVPREVIARSLAEWMIEYTRWRGPAPSW